MKKPQYKILQKLFNENINHVYATIGLNIEENFKYLKKEIKYLLYAKYIKYSLDYKNIILTKKGVRYITKEMNKDWLIKTTEWFKIRNIIGYIITTTIAIIALIISIISLLK